MTMKLTKHQQEMLDGKHGETKKFCMEKLTDFGEAVEAKEMVDLVLVLNCCPIYSKDRRNPETKKKLEMYDLGHSPLYDPIFAMKDAHVADETGTQCGNDPYLVQFDKVEEKGYPWNFELPGKGSFKVDDGNGHRPQGGLRQADGAWLAPLALVQPLGQHAHPQDGRVLRQLRIQRRGLHQHHPGRPHQSGIPHQHGLLRLHRLPAQVRQPPRRESGGQMHRRAG